MRLIALVLFSSLLIAGCDNTRTVADRDSPSSAGSGDTAGKVASTSPSPAVAIDSARFQQAVRSTFSSNLLDEVRSAGTTGHIRFKLPGKEKSYFTTGDRGNRIFAVESMKLFRDVPELDRLQLVIVVDRSESQVEVTRAEAEAFYNLRFAGMPEGDWKTKFLDRFDKEEMRKIFVKSFTGLRTVM